LEVGRQRIGHGPSLSVAPGERKRTRAGERAWWDLKDGKTALIEKWGRNVTMLELGYGRASEG
jgi:hypothetical protein